MFDNAPLFVSFGPIVDRMFVWALALIIFVYGVTAITWLIAEIQKLVTWIRVRWFGLEPDEPHYEVLDAEPVSPVLYEVMWSDELEHQYAANSRRRIVTNPMEGAYDLIEENGAGYIRYRVWLESPPPWGSAKWYMDIDHKLVLPKFPDDRQNVKAEDGDPV